MTQNQAESSNTPLIAFSFVNVPGSIPLATQIGQMRQNVQQPIPPSQNFGQNPFGNVQ